MKGQVSIISNGSKWAGEPPDTIATLVDVLGRETLDPAFEDYGDFYKVDSDGNVHVFGNFLTVSHVFNIHGQVEQLADLLAAIETNKATAAYKAAKRERRRYRKAAKAKA